MKKPKDFNIFRIRYYADKVNVRKAIFLQDDDLEQHKQHHERAEDYNNLFWQMVEKVTSIPHEQWAIKYFLSARECAIEELWDKHDILIPQTEEYFYWFIPKENTELTNWIQLNCKLPFKIIKRCEYSSCLDRKKTTWQREEAEKFTTENLSNLNLPNE